MRISDWSSDVCSSDLLFTGSFGCPAIDYRGRRAVSLRCPAGEVALDVAAEHRAAAGRQQQAEQCRGARHMAEAAHQRPPLFEARPRNLRISAAGRSEEHTSELQSLMRISYALFC